MKTYFVLILFFPLIAQALTMGEAINEAGRQRMLSQRMVKDYILIGRYRRKLSAKVELLQSIKLFEKQFQDLKKFVSTKEEKNAIKSIENTWKKYKKIVTVQPNKKKVLILEKLSEDLLTHSHHLVQLLEKRSGINLGYLVNLSGRQRMLTQRIAKYYLLPCWGFDDSIYQQKLEMAVSEFNNALHALLTAKENTSKIDLKLQQVQKFWNAFNITHRLKKGQFIPSLVTRTLDEILERMDKITELYAQLHQ